MTIINAKNFPLNCGTASVNSNFIYRKPNINKESFKLILNKQQRITSEGTPVSIVTIDDRNMQSYSNASYVEDVLAMAITNGYFGNIKYESQNSVTSKSNSDCCTLLYGNNGTAIIKATDDYGFSQIEKINITSYNASPISKFYSWSSGSIAKYLNDNMTSMLVNADANNKNLFTNSVIGSPSSYNRNSNLWIKNIDFTCISPWNSTGNNTRAGTLISKKHVIFCKHLSFYPTVNSTIKFVTNDNETITRTLIKVTPVGDLNSFAPDVVIGTLDSEVPNTISPVKILPSTYVNFFPTHKTYSQSEYNINCILTLNQFKNVGLASLNNFYNNNFALSVPVGYQSFSQSIISGDSGSPVFIILNGQLVLLGVFSGQNGGELTCKYTSEINNIMAIDGSYSLAEINLSSFTSY